MAAERWQDAVLSEIDRAAWFDLPTAHVKLSSANGCFSINSSLM
jgi:hypothetical protein